MMLSSGALFWHQRAAQRRLRLRLAAIDHADAQRAALFAGKGDSYLFRQFVAPIVEGIEVAPAAALTDDGDEPSPAEEAL